jgi:hypothetical protein
MDSFSRGRRCVVSGWRIEGVMNTMYRFVFRVAAISCLLAATAATATAQTTVRVSVDQSTIWTHDFGSPAAVVTSGTILAVVGQRNDWYEVVIPGRDGGPTGFIFKSLVAAATGPVPASPRERPAPIAAARTGRSRPIGLVGFGQASYMRFAARNSFQAVTGKAGGAFFGGGAEVRIGGGLFLGASVARFTKAGQRVVVYKEESRFADPGENTNTRFKSYHVLGGVELRNGWVATALEVEYSRIPDAIGFGGASAAFQESNLGGVVGRIKVLVGR